jgi:hypothetical protein
VARIAAPLARHPEFMPSLDPAKWRGVRPTLEVVLTETPAGLRRRKRPELGIA